MSKLFIVAGNSGVGKTYLLNNVNQINEKLKVVTKKTTRQIRQQERKYNNCDLQFGFSTSEVCKSDFYYSFRNEWYGFNKTEIESVFSEGKVPIFVVRRISTIVELKQAYPGIVKTILCKSSLSKDELISFLINRGASLSEAEKRVLSNSEEECSSEYDTNNNLFDCKITNHYDLNFLEEARKFILANIS